MFTGSQYTLRLQPGLQLPTAYFGQSELKDPMVSLFCFLDLPDPGGGCEGSSSPKFVYLGNFRVGLVCNDRVGSSLAVGRTIGLMGIRPARIALENMAVLSDLLREGRVQQGLLTSWRLMRHATRQDSRLRPACMKECHL
jgi:hypothetical protein